MSGYISRSSKLASERLSMIGIVRQIRRWSFPLNAYQNTQMTINLSLLMKPKSLPSWTELSPLRGKLHLPDSLVHDSKSGRVARTLTPNHPRAMHGVIANTRSGWSSRHRACLTLPNGITKRAIINRFPLYREILTDLQVRLIKGS